MVIDGQDQFFANDRETGQPMHTAELVYSHMLGQISLNVAGLPDARTLTMSEIRWFYNVLRGSLQRMTAPRKK